RRDAFPVVGELIVGTITTVNPYSAAVRLEEYDRLGMIHISEVSSRWVRDIREFAKENQRSVCKVVKVDEEQGHINLSLKRVSKEEYDRKMSDYKSEEKAEKILDDIGKKFGKNLDQMYEEIGYLLQDNFGSLFKAFKIALKDKNLLIKKGLDEKYADAIEQAATEVFQESEIEIKCKLNLTSSKPDGIVSIKKALLAAEKEGIEIRYISAPIYMLKLTGADPKKTEKKVKAIADAISVDIEKSGGDASYEFIY
ncbi:MAG: S1 RNA-binding domain-containing protein, partial [Candidatus Aenigmarchaeota archaeon]|nr:S1 RNA-binding domain-containing protein [Candidatus Aenigmarchaeota archaeon]